MGFFLFFFFFQAEDGIRDYKVTGVQTCALPISAHLKVAVDDVGARFELRQPKNDGGDRSRRKIAWSERESLVEWRRVGRSDERISRRRSSLRPRAVRISRAALQGRSRHLRARRPPQNPATGPGRLAACGGARSRSHRRSSRREPSVDPDRALTTR